MLNFQSAVLTLCDNLCNKTTSVIVVGKTADFYYNIFVYIFTTHFDLCRPSLCQRCQKQKQAVHKMSNYSPRGLWLFFYSYYYKLVCCGIRYVLYSLCGYRTKCILNGVAIYKFLSNSGHRRKDTSMPHTGVSAPDHNYYHLMTANIHNQEVGNVKL